MVSLAGLGFAQGLSTFGDSYRQAEKERKQAEQEKENAELRKKSALSNIELQQAQINKLNDDNELSDFAFNPLEDESLQGTKNESLTPKSETGQESIFGKPTFFTSNNTNVASGLDTESNKEVYGSNVPNYVRGAGLGMDMSAPITPAPTTGAEKPQTSKQIQQNTSLGLGAGSTSLYGIPRLNQNMDTSIGNINKIKEFLSSDKLAQAKSTLRSYIGKPKPQRGTQEYSDYLQAKSMYMYATKNAPSVLAALQKEAVTAGITGIKSSLEQQDYEGASAFASKLGIGNRFQKNKNWPNEKDIDILSVDGKVITTLPVDFVDDWLENGGSGTKELQEYRTQITEANTAFARQKVLKDIEKLNSAKAAELNKLWKAGTHYFKDVNNIFGFGSGSLVPINKENMKNTDFKTALVNAGVMTKTQNNGADVYTYNDGKIVEYDAKSMSDGFVINVFGKQSE